MLKTLNSDFLDWEDTLKHSSERLKKKTKCKESTEDNTSLRTLISVAFFNESLLATQVLIAESLSVMKTKVLT